MDLKHKQGIYGLRYGVYGTRSGVSLLISLVLVGILVLFGLGVSNLVVESIRRSADYVNANKAYYAAEGALKRGLLENANAGGAGFTKDAAPVTYCKTGETCPKATVKIQGKVPVDAKIGDEFVIPAPGTGNVGKDCNPLTAVKTGSFVYTYNDASSPPPKTGTGQAIDHPCNWNKIKVGDTVVIPLYTTNADGTINNPANIGLSNLKVKIRAACRYGSEICPANLRYDLDGYTGDEIFKCTSTKTNKCGDTIVNWQISGSNKKGDKVYTLLPNDMFNTGPGQRWAINSEIYESNINDAQSPTLLSTIIPGFSCSDYCVLYADLGSSQRTGKELTASVIGSIMDFLLDVGDFNRPLTDDKISKPVLKLSVIHSLNEYSSGDTVPYLEYQITTNSSLLSQPADTAQTITAEGFSGTFKQVLEVKQPQESGLLEYVIQQ